MVLTVLYWNIWLDNQIKGEASAEVLLKELKRLCLQYKPDFIGLNEVLMNNKTGKLFVLDYLARECGYTFNSFAPASELTDEWTIGAGFCSKTEPSSIDTFVLCNDSSAEKRGYEGRKIRAVAAHVAHMGKQFQIIVAHPPLFRCHTVKDHYAATKTIEELVRSEEYSKNTILGCDFNEPGFTPNAFKHAIKDSMYMRTGTAFDTTWRHRAKPTALIRANLDQLYWSKDGDLTLTTFEVVKTSISDHRPLVATFRTT